MRYRRARGRIARLSSWLIQKWEEFQDIIQAPQRERLRYGDCQDAPEANAGGFKASRTDPDHPWPSYVAKSVTRTTGEETMKPRNSGGSICNYIFQDTLGLPLCWIRIPMSVARSMHRMSTSSKA